MSGGKGEPGKGGCNVAMTDNNLMAQRFSPWQMCLTEGRWGRGGGKCGVLLWPSIVEGRKENPHKGMRKCNVGLI